MEGVGGTVPDLPFPPCVAMTVQTATESKPAGQTDRHH